MLPLQIACALAAQGASLDEVMREASAAAACLGSCGVAASVCTVPGSAPSTRHVRLLISLVASSNCRTCTVARWEQQQLQMIWAAAAWQLACAQSQALLRPLGIQAACFTGLRLS